MAERKRITAFGLVIVVVFVVLCSFLYPIKNLEHDCPGDECPVCEQIKTCENTLHRLSLAVGAASSVLFLLAIRFQAEKPVSLCESFMTLVSLKVKLSN